MSNGDREPSQKSLGKRPAVDGQNAPPASRPTRVLPSRSRRGGPGIGSCDVDAQILDAQKRKFDSEPLLPTDTTILLTTNSSLASTSTSELELNGDAFQSYFDRPEVLKAYKQQQIIETPEFSALTDDATVGGRFRPRGRGTEDELADTSDAMYEKRHRKFETFEKRGRFREKEKLKHEQYKLKERIEQLRGMDGAAFLSLPASHFSNAGKVHDIDDDDSGIQDLPGIHVNGAALYNEGERRRKEILETAATLEERYRVLLPPDRVRAPEKERKSTTTPRDSVEPEPTRRRSTRGQVEPEPEPMPMEVHIEPFVEKLKLKIKFPLRESTAMIEDVESKPIISARRASIRSSAPPVPRPRTRSSAIESPAVEPEPIVMESEPIAMESEPIAMEPEPIPMEEVPPSPARSPLVSFERPLSSVTNADYVPSPESPQISLPPPRKRARRSGDSISASLPNNQDREDSVEESPKKIRHRTVSGPGGPESGSGVLMTAAVRSSGDGRKVHRTQRHVNAFGTKVHQELEEVRDFEIPDWIRESVHMVEDTVPPESHSATWFAEQVNGGSHVSKSVSELAMEEKPTETASSLTDDVLLAEPNE